MSKLSNCLTMLQLLNNGRKYSIKELSEKLEVSERMVRVYKEDLEKCGIIIDTIMGPFGGYVLKKDIYLPKMKFTKDDYEYIRNIKDDNKEKEVLKDKIYSCILEKENEKNIISDDIKSYFNILARAIKNHNKVLINYYSYTHGNQDRVIHPLDMFLFNNGWGVAAYCEKKKDLRHFELSRINKIELLNEKY